MGIIIRQSFKASISNYVGVFLGFINMFILFPLFFSPEEMGAVRLFMELGTVLAAFALFGTNSSINRFFPYFKTNDQKHHGFFFWVLLIPSIGFLLLTVTLFLFGTEFFLFINENALQYKGLFPMLICLIFSNIFIIVSEVSCANHGKIAITNFSKEILMRVLIIVSASLYYFKLINFETCIWLIALSYAVTMILNIFYLRSLTKINLRPDIQFLNRNKKLKHEMISYSLILLFSALSSLVIPKIDFFLVSKLQVDFGKVAIYSIGYYLANFIEIPKRTIIQISLPIISGHLKNDNYTELNALNKKNGTNQLIISSLLFFLIWLNIENLYDIMPNGDYYREGKWVVFIIGFSKVLESMNSTYSPFISYSKLYKWMPLIIFFNGGFTIAFNYFFILKYGYIGGAISNILSMLVLNLICLGLIQWKLSTHPFEKAQLKAFGIFAFFFAFTFLGDWFNNAFVDAGIKTIILGTAFLFLTFKFKVSKDFNDLLRSKIKWINGASS